eukprot:CAMPEP_0176338540 /NCGR_PEP_ID=MMETSP0126-20121128/43_1 /TAXON_ID=141414 ORGANISM="Strombidinopsis acuminatum, Strain SPMC142" /NCGR_SAMPLE_ID=MMETSP0126 /ASSEMBLY_ACC=CAM_ASM_000229 /LENGTH=136 /DNA_ID=CAMNT_0017681585 /DNA_START=490 /DNA_END=900 /DNA_ORIENTATION=+
MAFLETINESAAYSWDSTTRLITISNAFETDLTAPVGIAFAITNGIYNPPSEKPTGEFIFRTADPNGQTIDEGSYESIIFTANEIQAIVVRACADKFTASQTDDICSYELKVTIGASYPILVGSSIYIVLPRELEL